MRPAPIFVGIDVSKLMLDVAVRVHDIGTCCRTRSVSNGLRFEELLLDLPAGGKV